LSSAETIETTPHPEEGIAAGEDHAGQAGDDHTHHDHSHDAPTLNPECTREIQVEVPADEVDRSFRTILKRYQKAARIPGFRSGKVPESIIRGRFASEMRQEVLESLLPQYFRSAIAAQSLQPVSQPQVANVELEPGKPLRFKPAFEVIPEFSIDGYDQVKVDRPDVSLTEAEFDAELDRIRDSRSTMEPVSEDRPLVDGDFADISFTGTVQAPPSESEAQPANEPIVGQDVLLEVGGKNTLESFTSALRGAKPGQQLRFEVSYPADFGERKLAGTTVAYDVEVKGIKKKVQPEWNDEFAKELGEYESFADFSQKLREHLANDKRRRLETETRDRLVEALVAKYDFPVPESLVQQQIDARLDRGLRALAHQGMRTEDMRKLDFTRLRAAQRATATAEVKGSIMLDRIAQAEQIQVPEEEVDHELEMIALQTHEPLEALRKRLTGDGSLARIREQLRREKAGSRLYERLAQ
jgi:trigger factor